MISQFAPRLFRPVSERDHIRGAAGAPATLLEYGDYQCPFCGHAHIAVMELLSRMGDQFRFVFRNFPLTTIHPYAEPAAEAAEAAGAQGKFWEMHDILYENQQALEPADLLRYATGLGLDIEDFTDSLAHHAYYDLIREDFMSGVRSGVNGTPSFFINGVRYDGSLDPEALASALILAATQMPPLAEQHRRRPRTQDA